MLNKPIKIRIGKEHFIGASRYKASQCLVTLAVRDGLSISPEKYIGTAHRECMIGQIDFAHDGEDIVRAFDGRELVAENFGEDRFITLTPITT